MGPGVIVEEGTEDFWRQKTACFIQDNTSDGVAPAKMHLQIEAWLIGIVNSCVAERWITPNYFLYILDKIYRSINNVRRLIQLLLGKNFSYFPGDNIEPFTESIQL